MTPPARLRAGAARPPRAKRRVLRLYWACHRLEDVASGIRGQGGTVLVLESDITDEQQATDAVGRTVAELGLPGPRIRRGPQPGPRPVASARGFSPRRG